jgi:hypothetical protein
MTRQPMVVEVGEPADFRGDNGICKSLCNVRLETYHGALVMDRRILDCSRCMICVWDGFAQPHS